MTVVPTHLPVQLTSFIGRQHELTEARRLLAAKRLLTLTGPGGSGKTRLSLELAAAVASEFADGVYFASLAPISDASLVLPSIAQLIGLHDAREASLLDHIVAHLHERRMLLILDNFEHLLAAAPSVGELLQNGGAEDPGDESGQTAHLRRAGIRSSATRATRSDARAEGCHCDRRIRQVVRGACARGLAGV